VQTARAMQVPPRVFQNVKRSVRQCYRRAHHAARGVSDQPTTTSPALLRAPINPDLGAIWRFDSALWRTLCPSLCCFCWFRRRVRGWRSMRRELQRESCGSGPRLRYAGRGGRVRHQKRLGEQRHPVLLVVDGEDYILLAANFRWVIERARRTQEAVRREPVFPPNLPVV